MTSAAETALEMIEAVYGSDKTRQVIGVYDAPLRVRDDPNKSPLSTLAVALAEQIKIVQDTLDTPVVQLRLPFEPDAEEEEQQVREVKENEEVDSFMIVKAYAVGTSAESKLKTVPVEAKEDPEDICLELTKDKHK